MTEKWAIMACEDCGRYFAIEEEPKFQFCPNCGSEETTGTGEYLSPLLYTEDGQIIK
jgi:RNA polymerase subunit RPABC4/transcription elongation factor Spt4